MNNSPSAQNRTSSESTPIRSSFSFHEFSKYLAIFVAVFFTAIVQTGFFLKWRPLGASPDLCLALCIAVSLKWGAKKGAIVGIMSGFCIDAFSSVGFSLLIPFYFIISIIIGLYVEGKNTSGFPVFISITPIATLLRVLLTFFELCISTPSFSATATFVYVLLPHFIVTLIASPLFYLSVTLIEKLFGKDDKTTRH